MESQSKPGIECDTLENLELVMQAYRDEAAKTPNVTVQLTGHVLANIFQALQTLAREVRELRE